jgi:hypothetical protein
VAPDEAAFSAAQAVRRQHPEAWAELDAPLQERARHLARKASAGGHALFLGAGVSAGAGLPLWGELQGTLADRAGFAGEERHALGRLHPLDQAGVIEKRLGGDDGLRRAVRDIFSRDHYTLSHALLAALPVREAVTANYDQLLEQAWQAAGRRPSVLPYAVRPDADCWVLKMHGCVAHPEDIVLTRDDHAGYGERDPLAGVVQALLITRHMLFVGFSLTDETFHRIAGAVRRVVRRADGPLGGVKPFGTAVVLERSPLVEELWGDDLRWASMSAEPDAGGAAAARRLEVFLDYLVDQTRDDRHLLDDRYVELLTEPERRRR